MEKSENVFIYVGVQAYERFNLRRLSNKEKSHILKKYSTAVLIIDRNTGKIGYCNDFPTQAENIKAIQESMKK